MNGIRFACYPVPRRPKPEAILTSAESSWRVAAQARAAGNTERADYWAGIGDALYERYESRLADEPSD